MKKKRSYDVQLIFPKNVDLNECTEADRGGCAQGCQNSIGGFQCFCGDGFTLNADNKTCNGKYIFLYFIFST